MAAKDPIYRDVCPKCGARRIDSQLGLEESPEEYLTKMVAVFREVWRVLRDDGTLWINLGDSYAANGPGGDQKAGLRRAQYGIAYGKQVEAEKAKIELQKDRKVPPGLKPKDLCMMPARLAMALQADGWYLRSEIVWHKPNPLPESVTDRPTKAHEMIYLLAKNGGKPLIWKARDTGEWSSEPDLSEMIGETGIVKRSLGRVEQIGVGKQRYHRENESSEDREKEDEVPRWKGFDYFYDAEAIREKSIDPESINGKRKRFSGGIPQGDSELKTFGRTTAGLLKLDGQKYEMRKKRSVWTIATQPYSGAHFATFPEEIPKLCILAGSRSGDTILDPFAGSGTVGKVALELGRRSILIELSPEYVKLALERTNVTPGFLWEEPNPGVEVDLEC